MTQDVKNLKLCNLTAEMAKFAGPEEINRDDCKFCNGVGSVSGTDQDGYSWSLACVCGTGRLIAEAQKCTRWNGTSQQRGKNGIMTIPGVKQNESQPAIYARGCTPDKDSVGNILGNVVVGKGFTDRAVSLEINRSPIDWEE